MSHAGRIGMAMTALVVWHWALIVFSGAGLHVDEAQYWDWSRDLAWGYYSKPPVIAGLIRLGTLVAGDGVWGIRWPAVLCWVSAGAVLGHLGQQMMGRRAGAWAAWLFWLTPAATWLGLVATTDAPLVLCWSIWMLWTWRALHPATSEQQVGWAWLAAGVALGLGLLSKYTMAAAVPCVVLWMLWQRHGLRAWVGLAGALVVAGVLSSPHWMWNHAWQWPTLRHTADITLQAQAKHGWSSLGACGVFLLGQCAMLGPAAAWVAWRIWRTPQGMPGGLSSQRHSEARGFALALSLPLWGLGAWQAWHAHAELNWAAPALLGGCLWLSLTAQAHVLPRRGWVGALVFSGVLCSVVPVVGRWAPQGPHDLPPVWDIWARMRGWEAAFNGLRPALARFPDDPILTGQRDWLVHARHAWRDVPRAVTTWPAPTQLQARHHYELTSPWPRPDAPDAPAHILWLGHQLPEAAWRAHYRCVTGLGRSRHGRVDASLWRLSRAPCADAFLQCADAAACSAHQSGSLH